ncbi:WD repeat-containing protein 3 [Armadillidium nasatum]|uniref:WD repeat-containing protein 3 n=1 Tax=Armadillidium nasatum TaxID=96803 RepID=A0A5N5T3H4_9CRUS|nr:WD repeat-containing protein 3 [Armadillidium nasatum]
MGQLTKQYLRYVPGQVFGIVGSGRCIHLITKSRQKEKYVIVPACESVILWDLRRKVKILTLNCQDIQGIVSAVEIRPAFKDDMDNTHVAVGYSEGTLVLYDLSSTETPVKFNGHKGGITTIAWDPQGMRVASGSENGEIVLWDMVSEKGIVRLLGHKGRINKVCFLQNRNILVSCGIDKFIKFWDLDTNFCFYTLTLLNGVVSDFIIFKNDSRLLAGERELKCFSIKFVDEKIGKQENYCNKFDTVQGKLKIPKMEGSEEEKNLQGDDDDGETDDKNKMEQRIMKAKKRARDLDVGNVNENLSLSDELKKIPPMRAMYDVYGVSVTTLKDGTIKMATLHADNSIALYSSHVNLSSKNKDSDQFNKQECTLYLPAHRTEIRGIAITSFGDKLVTSSSESIKVWDKDKAQAIQTIECDYPLSLLLPPGDRHIVIGTKSGNIQLYDIVTGTRLDDLCAHNSNKENSEEGVWSMCMTHDGKGFLSGGSDCLVKFWKFELVEDNFGRQGKRLGIIQEKRALKVADQITCLKCSSTGKYFVVATFDLKETVYYMNSLKLLHEFYGKSMPSTCLDFSTDSTMIISGSKDSCIRIFATDFGDQKRLLKNCHQGGVTEVKFIPNTHLFFSCGNDGTIKQWDADNFQRITTLKQHFGIVRCMAVCPKGRFVVTAGQDRTIRLWEKTLEPLVLEDEREEERRIQEEEAGTTIQTPVVVGERGSEAVRPTILTKETEKAADNLLEVLVMYQQEESRKKKAKEKNNPLEEDESDDTLYQLLSRVYGTHDPLKIVLLALKKIKSSELEEAILILPLNLILVLIICIHGFLARKWNTELSTRVLLVAVRTNMPQLIACKESALIIRSIANSLPQAAREMQDTIGFNYAGLKHMVHRFENRNEDQLFIAAAEKVKNVRRRGKKKQKVRN